jgi:S-adenosylmethionine decarboxylase
MALAIWVASALDAGREAAVEDGMEGRRGRGRTLRGGRAGKALDFTGCTDGFARARPVRALVKVASMRGLHLTADLYDCRCEQRWLTDAQQLGAWCTEAAHAVGFEVEQELFAPGRDAGSMSVVLLLGGSHVCLHAWQADRSASVDVCVAHGEGDLSAKARGLMFALVQRFQPDWTEQRSLDRGDGE